MNLNRKLSDQFDLVVSHVKNTHDSVVDSGAAVMVIHNDSIVTEKYWGNHSQDSNSRPTQEDTQFPVASVRKSYIGFAVAYAVYHGYIASIDDPVTKYLPELDHELLKDTTIRHLLTHTHGLIEKEGQIDREFSPGQSWAYHQPGINMLIQIVKRLTGKTVAELISEQVFDPLQFSESGWYGEKNENLAEVILRFPDDPIWSPSESIDGDESNMYVSARELAFWGYLHLKEGLIDGKQVVSKEILKLATTLQSPSLPDKNLPQNGFLWFVKDLLAEKTEIGELVPEGSFQILGYSGVAVLVIPKHSVVAVRMFNSYGSPDGYDYLADIRGFGDTVMQCLNQSK